MKIARVFPNKIKNATPDDPLAFIGAPPMLFPPEVDEVHISVSFSWDEKHIPFLVKQWEAVAPVKVGGPAIYGSNGDFVPGMYLKRGYIITSRGCPNRCPDCLVPEREPVFKELPIREGWIVQDNNLLACSEQHIRSVFAMLKTQPCKAEFTGGIESALLKPWHVELFAWLKPKQIFFAYDYSCDYEPLMVAAGMMKEAGFTRSVLRSYVLCGGPRDSIAEAEERMWQVVDLGIYPFCMVLCDPKTGRHNPEWETFRRKWDLPAIIASREIQRKFAKQATNSRSTIFAFSNMQS
jgi:hypothetical protein